MSEQRKSVACPECKYQGFTILMHDELPENYEHRLDKLPVKCGECGQHFIITIVQGPVRVTLTKKNAGYDVSDLAVGDVLELKEEIENVPMGLWSVLELGWIIRLARVGKNEDGELSTLNATVNITRDEAQKFVPHKMKMEPLEQGI